MSNSEKHGMLVFDEISLKESISVNTNTLTYQGFEDFGNDVRYEKSDNKRNHGLFVWKLLSALSLLEYLQHMDMSKFFKISNTNYIIHLIFGTVLA
ncbi:Uncharacterized protein FWK35_00020187 [Aphis craccivora]|uniref:Transposable element P transposase-like RNase H domain-containing protein n=1 Tax=Aphis craccivora TaxID=307492 RepID=A0A6G0W282_APHCR|nr:Uncharacterized protein FWK35_00020187 [Aphis craccivora]